jgi:hypothetical protein
MFNKFWFVWNEQRSLPRHKHPSLGDANREAERLARQHPGETFTVLRAVGTCTKNDVIWTSEEAHFDDLPF